ncbi:MAG TPA: TolC family protein [Terriglobia bacterium]|nr:TolC family protein [Terriglobia bacterium]
MLRINVEESPGLTLLRLEGRLAGPWVGELEHLWTSRAAQHVPQGTHQERLALDLSAVTFVDDEGKKLLGAMFADGAELRATDCMNKSIIERIKTSQRNSRSTPRSGGLPGRLMTLVTIVCFLGMPAGLRGQEKPALRLTLRDAVQLALKQNPQVQVANLNVAESQQDRNIARSALLPHVGAEGSILVQRFNVYALFGRPLAGFPEHAGPAEDSQAGPQFSMPLFDLTLLRRWQASQQGVRASLSDEMGVREQTVLLVVSQYLGSLRAAADVKAAQSRVTLAQAIYDQAADLQKNGVGTGLDTLRSNVQLQNEKQRLVVAETALKTSLYGLARLLNLDVHQDVVLADEVSFFETPEFPVNQSLESAFANRPELKAIEAREQQTLTARRAASESRLPTFNLRGNWGYQGLSLPSSIPAYNYQAVLDVPVFTGGRIRAEITRSDIEVKKLDQQKQALTDQIALEVKTAIAELDAARNEVEVANLGVKLAQEEVTQARDRFQAGVANNIEVVTAQDELSRANDNQISALYRYNQARADLAHSLGQMESLYSK